MSSQMTTDYSASEEVLKWAERKIVDDGDYIRHAAQFGNPLVRCIAAFILEIARHKEVPRRVEMSKNDRETQKLPLAEATSPIILTKRRFKSE